MSSEFEMDRAPLLSKYERVKIISSRIEQLLDGAPPLIDIEEFSCVNDLAEAEFSKGLLPVSVARKLESGRVKVYPLTSFIDPSHMTPSNT